MKEYKTVDMYSDNWKNSIGIDSESLEKLHKYISKCKMTAGTCNITDEGVWSGCNVGSLPEKDGASVININSHAYAVELIELIDAIQNSRSVAVAGGRNVKTMALRRDHVIQSSKIPVRVEAESVSFLNIMLDIINGSSKEGSTAEIVLNNDNTCSSEIALKITRLLLKGCITVTGSYDKTVFGQLYLKGIKCLTAYKKGSDYLYDIPEIYYRDDAPIDDNVDMEDMHEIERLVRKNRGIHLINNRDESMVNETSGRAVQTVERHGTRWMYALSEKHMKSMHSSGIGVFAYDAENMLYYTEMLHYKMAVIEEAFYFSNKDRKRKMLQLMDEKYIEESEILMDRYICSMKVKAEPVGKLNIGMDIGGTLYELILEAVKYNSRYYIRNLAFIRNNRMHIQGLKRYKESILDELSGNDRSGWIVYKEVNMLFGHLDAYIDERYSSKEEKG